MDVVRDFLASPGLPRGDLNELPGQEQVVASLQDCLRAAVHGFRSVLIADLGVLSVFARAGERVRRARLGLELLRRSGYGPQTSELGAPGSPSPL